MPHWVCMLSSDHHSPMNSSDHHSPRTSVVFDIIGSWYWLEAVWHAPFCNACFSTDVVTAPLCIQCTAYKSGAVVHATDTHVHCRGHRLRWSHRALHDFHVAVQHIRMGLAAAYLLLGHAKTLAWVVPSGQHAS